MTSIYEAEQELQSVQDELTATLAELQDRLNVPKQAKRLGRKAQQSYQERPLAWVAGAAGVAVTVAGLLIWNARR